MRSFVSLLLSVLFHLGIFMPVILGYFPFPHLRKSDEAIDIQVQDSKKSEQRMVEQVSKLSRHSRQSISVAHPNPNLFLPHVGLPKNTPENPESLRATNKSKIMESWTDPFQYGKATEYNGGFNDRSGFYA
jgi:hypothetical protein